MENQQIIQLYENNFQISIDNAIQWKYNLISLININNLKINPAVQSKIMFEVICTHKVFYPNVREY